MGGATEEARLSPASTEGRYCLAVDASGLTCGGSRTKSAEEPLARAPLMVEVVAEEVTVGSKGDVEDEDEDGSSKEGSGGGAAMSAERRLLLEEDREGLAGVKSG